MTRLVRSSLFLAFATTAACGSPSYEGSYANASYALDVVHKDGTIARSISGKTYLRALDAGGAPSFSIEDGELSVFVSGARAGDAIVFPDREGGTTFVDFRRSGAFNAETTSEIVGQTAGDPAAFRIQIAGQGRLELLATVGGYDQLVETIDADLSLTVMSGPRGE